METQKKKIFDLSLFKRLLHFISPFKKVFYGSLVCVIGLAIFGALRPWVLQKAIDEHVALKSYDGFMFLIIAMILLLVLEVVCQLLFIYFASWLGQSVVKDIRVKLYNHVLRFRMKYYDKSSVGVLITRTVTDMERIADIFGQGLFMIFSDVLKMLVVGAVMAYINWKLALIAFVTMPIVLFATKIFQRYMKRAFEEVRNEVSNLNSFVQERITGMKILQLFTREATEFKKFKAINERHKKGWLKTVWYNSVFFPIADLLSSITLGTIIWVGGLMVYKGSGATEGDLFAFIMFVPMLFRPLNQIANKFNTLQMGMVAADRVFKVLDTTSQIDDTGELEASEFKGDIKFEGVHFSYVEDEDVLKGINLEVRAGQTIAIVGSTGAGKSTIINLLNRFYDIQNGTIYIDGTDIKHMTLKSLRAQIAVVLQDVFLFADTILNNITLKNDAISEEEVIQAAKDIGIHDFIMSLPNGYHYNVKERGVMLVFRTKTVDFFFKSLRYQPEYFGVG